MQVATSKPPSPASIAIPQSPVPGEEKIDAEVGSEHDRRASTESCGQSHSPPVGPSTNDNGGLSIINPIQNDKFSSSKTNIKCNGSRTNMKYSDKYRPVWGKPPNGIVLCKLNTSEYILKILIVVLPFQPSANVVYNQCGVQRSSTLTKFCSIMMLAKPNYWVTASGPIWIKRFRLLSVVIHWRKNPLARHAWNRGINLAQIQALAIASNSA